MSVRACDACCSIKQKCDGTQPSLGGCGRCKRLGISCDYARLSGATVDNVKHRAITIRRVRTGCLNCKKRKKKCDNSLPRCSDCRRLNLQCVSAPATSRIDGTDRCHRKTRSRSVSQPISPIGEADQPRNADSTRAPATSPRPRNDILSYPQQWAEPLYEWLDPTIIPSSNSSENGSHWNGEEDPMVSMASIALDFASIEDFLLQPGSPIVPFSQDDTSEKQQAIDTSLSSNIPGLAPQILFTGSPLEKLTAREDRYLFHHYVNVVARSLCIASPQELNPFLKLMLPLASNSPAVMGAMLALSACHLQHNGGFADFVRAGLGHHTSALAALNNLIEEGSQLTSAENPFDTHLLALGAILILCITDIRQGNSTNWLWHITAAKNIIASRMRSTSHFGPSSDPWPFLLDLFEYVDSIITISKCKPPLVDHQRTMSDAEAARSKYTLNPIFGVSRPLIRFIGQISALSNRRKYRVNAVFDEKFRQSAAVIAENLRAWEPELQIPSIMISVQDTDLYAAVHCAHAIKYASILRLHQVVDGYKTPSPVSTECLSRILDHVNHVPIGSSAENSLVFPLFMAGVVSLNEEDRMTVLCRWSIIERTIGFGNVSKGRVVLEKVWKLMDQDIKTAKELGQEQCTEVNWARIRWFDFSELVLF